MRKFKRSIMIAILIFATTPTVVFAQSWVEKQTEKMLTFIAKLIFEPLLEGMLSALEAMMSTPSFDDPNLSFVKIVMQDMQILAASLLALNLAFRIWKFQTGTAFGGQTEPFPDIIYRTCMSGVLIFGLPEILNKLMELNSVLIQYISERGMDFTELMEDVTIPGTGDFIMLLVVCIFIIALVGLTISNAMRIAELCLLYVFAPIMAVSYAGKGETFQIWITQAVSVSLTQCVQFYLLSLSINFMGNISTGEWWSWIAPIGAIVISIRGPQLLKQFLYSSGVGGFATGAAQSVASSAIYSKMMKVGK